MQEAYPYPEFEGKRSIGTSILLSLITCGIYGLYWQSKLMKTLNAWLGKREFSFLKWFFLALITCGIYAVYRGYRIGKVINELQSRNGLPVAKDLPIISMLLTLVGLGATIQQYYVNEFYTSDGKDNTSDRRDV